MKFNINTYEDYLNLSLKDEENMSEEFDLLTDNEFSKLDSFHLRFNYELDKVYRERNNNLNSLVIEGKERLLTDEEFYNWPHWKILAFFGGKLNE